MTDDASELADVGSRRRAHRSRLGDDHTASASVDATEAAPRPAAQTPAGATGACSCWQPSRWWCLFRADSSANVCCCPVVPLACGHPWNGCPQTFPLCPSPRRLVFRPRTPPTVPRRWRRCAGAAQSDHQPWPLAAVAAPLLPLLPRAAVLVRRLVQPARRWPVRVVVECARTVLAAPRQARAPARQGPAPLAAAAELLRAPPALRAARASRRAAPPPLVLRAQLRHDVTRSRRRSCRHAKLGGDQHDRPLRCADQPGYPERTRHRGIERSGTRLCRGSWSDQRSWSEQQSWSEWWPAQSLTAADLLLDCRRS